MQIVSREEMQTIDRTTVESMGLPGVVLMENAGRAVFQSLLPELKKGGRMVIVIGKGNNGGDGFAAARYLLETSYPFSVWLITEREAIKGDAEIHMKAFLAAGGEIQQISSSEAFKESLESADLIVDALLGTGLTGELRPSYIQTVKDINRASGKVISIDMPSGVNSDQAAVDNEAIKADITLTLHCPKISQFLYPASSYFGETRVLSIGIPGEVMKRLPLNRKLLSREDVIKALPHRDPHSHKGTYGNGLLVAGSEWMPGAAAMSGLAALRSGLGRLTVSVPERMVDVLSNHIVEATYTPRHAIAWNDFDGAAIGPGLGREKSAEQLVAEALRQEDLPLVLDADGLYHLKGLLPLLKNRKAPVILTPHPGEMARLTGYSIEEVEKHRFQIAETFAREHHVYLVLKGQSTIFSNPEGETVVHTSGNPALAKGGSGDVLTGIIFAFLFQHHSVEDAVNNAIYLHGTTAEYLIQVQHSMLDVLATDIINAIPSTLHDLYRDTNC